MWSKPYLWWSGGATAEERAAVTQAGYVGVGVRLGGSADVTRAAAWGNLLVAIELVGDVHSGRWSVPPAPEGLPRELVQSEVRWHLALGSSAVSDQPSAPRADGRAAAMIRSVLGQTQAAGTLLALAPHPGSWMQRTQDAVRLGMRINQARLGVVLRQESVLEVDGMEMEASVQLALPKLMDVRLPAERPAAGILQRLRQLGYGGPVGVHLGSGGGSGDSLAAAPVL